MPMISSFNLITNIEDYILSKVPEGLNETFFASIFLILLITFLVLYVIAIFTPLVLSTLLIFPILLTPKPQPLYSLSEDDNLRHNKLKKVSLLSKVICCVLVAILLFTHFYETSTSDTQKIVLIYILISIYMQLSIWYITKNKIKLVDDYIYLYYYMNKDFTREIKKEERLMKFERNEQIKTIKEELDHLEENEILVVDLQVKQSKEGDDE